MEDASVPWSAYVFGGVVVEVEGQTRMELRKGRGPSKESESVAGSEDA